MRAGNCAPFHSTHYDGDEADLIAALVWFLGDEREQIQNRQWFSGARHRPLAEPIQTMIGEVVGLWQS